MGFPSALLRRRAPVKDRAASKALSAPAAPGQDKLAAFQLHWSNKERPVPSAAKGTGHSDSVETGAGSRRGSPRSEGNPTDEEKQAAAPYTDDTTRAAHVLAGKISMPQTRLALMGDGEVWFSGHPHTLEPAVVSGFHRLHWLGR